MSIATAIENISNHLKNAYDELQGLGANLTNVNKNIENISMVLDNIYDSMPRVSGESISLTLDDTKIGKIKSTLKGNTSQNGTPTPTSPIPVNVVSGDNTIKVEGKNSFDKDTATIISAYFDNNTTTITASGTNKSTYWEVQPNTTYTISKFRSVRGFIGTTTTTPTAGVSVSNIVLIGYGTYDGVTRDSGTITTGANDKYIVINYTNTNSETGNIPTYIFDSIMINVGSTAGDYEPYQSQTYPINLPSGMELCNIPNTDYEDTFIHDKTLDKWYLHKEIGKVVLDGSEEWISLSALNTANYYAYYYLNSNLATPSDSVVGVLSNYFIGDKRANRTADKSNCWLNISASQLFIHSPEASTNNFKNWLNSHNATFYFISKTSTDTEITYQPLIEQLNNLEKAMSYNGQTNISQVNNNLPFIINATALMGNSD